MVVPTSIETPNNDQMEMLLTSTNPRNATPEVSITACLCERCHQVALTDCTPWYREEQSFLMVAGWLVLLLTGWVEARLLCSLAHLPSDCHSIDAWSIYDGLTRLVEKGVVVAWLCHAQQLWSAKRRLLAWYVCFLLVGGTVPRSASTLDCRLGRQRGRAATQTSSCRRRWGRPTPKGTSTGCF